MILRITGYLFGIGTVLFLAVAAGVAWYVSDIARDLPNYDVLAQYEPPVMTRVHASDGQLVAEYAHERRLYLPIQAIPDIMKAAFISAEDKNFYEHAGLDYYGIELSKNAAPLLKYAERIFSRPAYIEALTPSEKVMRK